MFARSDMFALELRLVLRLASDHARDLDLGLQVCCNIGVGLGQLGGGLGSGEGVSGNAGGDGFQVETRANYLCAATAAAQGQQAVLGRGGLEAEVLDKAAGAEVGHGVEAEVTDVEQEVVHGSEAIADDGLPRYFRIPFRAHRGKGPFHLRRLGYWGPHGNLLRTCGARNSEKGGRGGSHSGSSGMHWSVGLRQQ